jgi:hypothetical protein
MDRIILRNDQWERLSQLLPGKSSDCGVTAKDNRLCPMDCKNWSSLARSSTSLWSLASCVCPL